MAKHVIQVEALSKQYRLGTVGTGTLAHDLNRWWHKVRGKENPYLTVGEDNDRTSKGSSDYVWALKNINFNVEDGDVLGIIGRNGAGKSTLLKLLSRTTAPTTGSIKIKGRIASLLEVGTGFHPELSGRDNIYLNGAILGMTKQEVSRNFDEIVDFAGVERYIDTPVKRYSSGMYVRLAFAVAAHLEPDILIVDEVLAVGDADFQKKAIDKMRQVSTSQGRTVLFVSHNMTTMQKLCNKGLFLKNGKVDFAGTMQQTIDKYLVTDRFRSGITEFPAVPDLSAFVTKVVLEDENGNVLNELPVGRKWAVKVFYQVNETVEDFITAVGITNQYELSLKTSWQQPIKVTPGLYCAEFYEENTIFSVGQYKFNIGLSKGLKGIQYLEGVCDLNIIPLIGNVSESVVKLDIATSAILNPMTMRSYRI